MKAHTNNEQWGSVIHQESPQSLEVNSPRHTDPAPLYEEVAIGSYLRQTELLDHGLLRHSRAVAHHTRLMAEWLGFGPDGERELERSSLLHDLGMLGIDRQIRKKRGVLTSQEREILKLHPLHSARVISFIPGLRELIPAVRHHHEWFNGTGYPDRLTREQIPLMSRIITIADGFDALTHDRSHRKVMSAEEAFEVLYSRRETQYDPDLVDIFIAAVLGELRSSDEEGRRSKIVDA